MRHEFNCKFCGKHKIVVNKKSNSPIYCSLECNYQDPNKSHGEFEWDKATSDEKEEKIKKTFYEKVIISKESCWGWKKKLEPDGYARVAIGKRRHRQAHIVSWMIHRGDIAGGMFVLHKCHNRSCTNPDHLHLGTYQDNMNDMKEADRQAKGSNQGSAKLSEIQVIEIKKRLKKPRQAAKIAREFNVSKSLIGAIKQGLVWKHIN